MSADTDDQMYLFTYQLLHTLVRESEALAIAVERELLIDDGSKQITALQRAEFDKARSLYRDLEWRIQKKQLSFAKLVRTLGLIIREVNFFRVMVQNFYGSLDKDQPLTLNKRPVKLEALIEEIVDLFEYAAEAKGIEIKTHIAKDKTLAESSPTITLDRELAHRMIVNLIDNAIKYSFFSSESSHQRFISIDCRRHSIRGDWAISVASYGVGIDEEEIKTGSIFEYGVRGKFSTDRGRIGTGIGLAEAKRIVDAHGGKIHIDSVKQGVGTYLTTVKVILPRE